MGREAGFNRTLLRLFTGFPQEVQHELVLIGEAGF
jgi:hypothetical protein